MSAKGNIVHKVQYGSQVAILADIHGNSLALDAVLADIDSNGGADEYWLLGDYSAIGYDPIGVLERIVQLENATFIRGNTDRYLVENSQPWPTQADAESNPELSSLSVRSARSFAWSTGAVGSTGWIPWLQSPPLDFHALLPDGTKVLAVHASPGEDDGLGINPNTSESELKDLTLSTDYDLLLIGHTHSPFDLSYEGLRIVNPGSVSNPLPPDLRASYAFLEAKSDGYEIQFHRVNYDREAVVELARNVNHPAWEYIATFMSGDRRPDWMDDG